MADLTELIEKVKAATGPDRELDARVAGSLQIMPSNAFAPSASPDPGTFGTGAYSFWRTPDYTASLDACIALTEEVLPGWTATICLKRYDHPEHLAWADVASREWVTTYPETLGLTTADALASSQAKLREMELALKPFAGCAERMKSLALGEDIDGWQLPISPNAIPVIYDSVRLTLGDFRPSCASSPCSRT